MHQNAQAFDRDKQIQLLQMNTLQNLAFFGIKIRFRGTPGGKSGRH
jgi:hypothetical protein